MANEPTEQEKAAAEAAAPTQAAQTVQRTQQASSPAGADKGPINSAGKSPEDAAKEASALPGTPAAAEVAARGVELDHGEPDERVKADVDRVKESAKDPWGTTPLQMRDKHDPAVDPAKVGVATRPDGSGLELAGDARKPVAVSGINPASAGDDAPQGTLPPV
jgi:hypothetical protein